MVRGEAAGTQSWFRAPLGEAAGLAAVLWADADVLHKWALSRCCADGDLPVEVVTAIHADASKHRIHAASALCTNLHVVQALPCMALQDCTLSFESIVQHFWPGM